MTDPFFNYITRKTSESTSKMSSDLLDAFFVPTRPSQEQSHTLSVCQ